MSSDESILQFSNRIRQLSATLKSMNVAISESEIAMVLLNGLPEEYNALICALDAIDEDETKLKFEFIKSRVIQEEQRIVMRTKSAPSKSETAALLTSHSSSSNRNRGNRRWNTYCNYCKRPGHIEPKCWIKFPHLKPRQTNSSDSKPALIANHSEDPFMCLMAKYEKSNELRNSDKWFVDSGCSNHMTFNKSALASYTPALTSSVELGNSNTVKVAGIGSKEIPIMVNGIRVRCMLKNVLDVPELGYQLLSVPTFDKSGFTTSFHSKRCFISDCSELLATATMTGNLYKLDFNAPSEKALVAATTETWHRRLAHIQLATILAMAKSDAVKGLEIKNSNKSPKSCAGCLTGKAHRISIPKQSSSRSSQLLELVHSDVNGPIEVPSIGGSRYFVTFIDDFSRWTSLYTMKKKSDTINCFKAFHAYAEKHTGARLKNFNVIHRSRKGAEELKTLRSDNGGKYISNEFKSYLQQHDIQHQLTVEYTPQQNGVAERMNRTLMDCVRSMLQTAKLNKKFWADAMSTSVYIRNRVVSRSLPKNVTPHHRWIGEAPDLSHLPVFGCKCWFVIPKTKITELDPRSAEGLMMGYSTQTKGYKIWNTETSRLVVSRDVTFDESSVDPETIVLTVTEEDINNIVVPGGECRDNLADNIDLITDSVDNADNSETANSENEFVGAQDSPVQPPRRSDRIRKQTDECWKATNLLSEAFAINEVPTSYKVATSPDKISFWKSGIDREHDSLLRNHTWDLVNYNPGMKVLPCKYVFKVKENNPKVRLAALL